MSKRIKIEAHGNKIELRGWIGQQTPSLARSVPTAKWSPDNARGKCWTYALDLSVCRALRAAFGAELHIGPELNAWAREAVAHERALLDIAESDTADLVNVPRFAPRIDAATANRTYQRVAAAYGARAGSFGIFDQPGLGKTIETLAAIVEAQGDDPGAHLIFCPKVAVTSVWGDEIRHWLPEAQVFELKGTRAQREAVLAETLTSAEPRSNGSQVFVVANIEMARIKPLKHSETGRIAYPIDNAEYPALFGLNWDTVVVDESHRALVRKSGHGTQTRAGMDALGKRAARRIALSGTPMRGKAENLWGTLNWIRPDLYTSYWSWAKTYFKITSNGFSNFVLDGWQDDGEQRLGESLKTIGLRRTKAEVLPELPAKTYAGTYLIPGDDQSPHGVWLTMEPAQAKAYATFEREAQLDVEGGEIMATGILAENTRKKQFAGATLKMTDGKVTPTLPSVKFDWLVEKLGELGIVDGEGTGKIVVASQFTSLLNMFACELRALGIALHLLTGETPDAKRAQMRDDFQNNSEVRVFLLNTNAGGVAITLDVADDLVLLDETYNPDDQEQVEDRIHRTSRMHNVTIHTLRCLGTIEEEIAYITAARQSVTQYLLDGARGVEAARNIYLATVAK